MTGADTLVLTTRRRTAILLTGVAVAGALTLSACTSSGGGDQNSPGPGTSSNSGSNSSSPSAPKTLSASQLTVTFHGISPRKDAHLEGPVDLVQHQNVQQVSYSKATKTLTVTMKKGATTQDRQVVENLVNEDKTPPGKKHKKKHN